MRPLHVCFVSQEYPPETGWGGIGAYTYEMAHGLAAAGQKVTVVSRALDRETVEDTGGVIVHRVRYAPNLDGRRVICRLNRYWPGFAWAALKRVRKIHAEAKIDIVETAENRADGFFLTTLWSDSPVIVRLHTAWIFVDRHNRIVADRRKRFVYWLEKQSILRADALTAPSQAMVDLTRSWIRLDRRDVTVLPNPIDVARYSPDGDCCADRKTVVLYAGRLERKKLAPLAAVLPELMRRCPQAHFRFAGVDEPDDSGRSWQERLTESVPAEERHRLHFGFVTRDGLPELYRGAALCVAPSVWENFPYAAMEAMACGAAVVASRVGGIPEMIQDGVSGILVAPEDPAALADAICELLDAPLRRQQLGRNARRRAEELFSLQVVVDEMLAFYRTVVPGAC